MKVRLLRLNGMPGQVMSVDGHVAALVGIRLEIARERIIRPEYTDKLERNPVGDLPAVFCPLRPDIEVFGVVPLDEADPIASGGAGLDVLAVEPADPHNPLLTAPNCKITPHCAWTSREARLRLLDILEANLASFIRTGCGIHRVGV